MFLSYLVLPHPRSSLMNIIITQFPKNPVFKFPSPSSLSSTFSFTIPHQLPLFQKLHLNTLKHTHIHPYTLFQILPCSSSSSSSFFMEFQRPQYCLCFVLFTLLSYCSQAYVFYAGGRDGWVLKPSENYNHWAGRNRFQVNDTIVFKYKKGSNSVLVVNKEGYDKCNKNNPIKKFEDGDSVFKFDRSGPFYFISGTDSYCEKGQKLIVVVLAIRSPPPPPSVLPPPVSQPPVANQPSPAISPYPAPMMPPSSPPAPAVSPYPAPMTPPTSSPAPSISPNPSPEISPSSPSPAIIPPSVSPAPANVPSYPTPASAPAPAPTSPTPSPANTPAYSPTSSPSPATSTPGLSPPAPPASTPSSVPGSPGTPSASPPGSSNPSSSSSNETSPPPPNGSGAWDVAPSSLLVYAVTIVLSAALSGILGGQ